MKRVNKAQRQNVGPKFDGWKWRAVCSRSAFATNVTMPNPERKRRPNLTDKNSAIYWCRGCALENHDEPFQIRIPLCEEVVTKEGVVLDNVQWPPKFKSKIRMMRHHWRIHHHYLDMPEGFWEPPRSGNPTQSFVPWCRPPFPSSFFQMNYFAEASFFSLPVSCWVGGPVGVEGVPQAKCFSGKRGPDKKPRSPPTCVTCKMNGHPDNAITCKGRTDRKQCIFYNCTDENGIADKSDKSQDEERKMPPRKKQNTMDNTVSDTGDGDTIIPVSSKYSINETATVKDCEVCIDGAFDSLVMKDETGVSAKSNDDDIWSHFMSLASVVSAMDVTLKTRQSGKTAGQTDKYYSHPLLLGSQFRSVKQIERFVKTPEGMNFVDKLSENWDGSSSTVRIPNFEDYPPSARRLSADRNHNAVYIAWTLGQCDEGYWRCSNCTVFNEMESRFCSVCAFKVAPITRTAAKLCLTRISKIHDEEEMHDVEDTDDDALDGSFNQTDENKVMQKVKLLLDGEHKKRNSMDNTKNANHNFTTHLQTLDGTPTSCDDLADLNLVIACGRGRQNKYDMHQNFRLCCPKSIDKYVSRMVLVQRASLPPSPLSRRKWRLQMYVSADLDIGAHFVVGKNGFGELKRKLPAKLKRFHLRSDRDHVDAATFPALPLVVNTHAIVTESSVFASTCDGQTLPKSVPLLSLVEKGIGELLTEENLSEIIRVAEVNHRGVVSVNLSLTMVDHKSQDQANALAAKEPGVKLSVHGYSPSLRKAVGKLGLLMHDLLKCLLKGSDYQKCYEHDHQRGHFRSKLAKVLCVPDHLVPHFLPEGISINIGSIIGFHYDKENGLRRWFNAVTVASAYVNFSDLGLEPSLANKLKKILRVDELGSELVTVVKYTRKVVCDTIKRMNGEHCSNSPSFNAYLEKVHELVGTGKDNPGIRDRIDISNVGFPDFLSSLMKKLAAEKSQDYRGRFVKLPEGISKMFYFSSFIQAAYSLVLKHHKAMAYEDLEAMAGFFFRECNGQMLIFDVLFGFELDETFIDTFRHAKLQFGPATMYILFSKAFMKRKPQGEHKDGSKKEWFISTTTNRMQQSVPLLYQGEPGDLAKVQNYLGGLRVVLSEARVDNLSGDAIYNMLMKLDGLHHLKAMTAVQMAALLGLVDIKHAGYAKISGAGHYGSTEFFQKYGGKLNPSPDDIDEMFHEINTDLPKCGFHFPPSYNENHCCIITRTDRGIVKYDVLMFLESTGTFQTIFRFWQDGKDKEKGRHHLQFLYKNQWRSLEEVVMPFYKVQNLSPTTQVQLGTWFKDREEVIFPLDPFDTR